MKTKEKRFSIRYKFASRDVGNVAPFTGIENVPHFRQQECGLLGFPGGANLPGGVGPNWLAGNEASTAATGA